MNNRVYHQPYRIAVIVTLVLVSVLFTTACSAVPQSTEPDKKNNSSETKETQPELNVDDFAKIQTALRSLDNSFSSDREKRLVLTIGQFECLFVV